MNSFHTETGTEERLASIFKFANDAIVGKDLNGIITDWNKGAEIIFGFSSKEIIGTPIQSFLESGRLEAENLILKRIANGEEVAHFKSAWKHKDGRAIPISITVSPIIDKNGKVVGVSQIARDISEQIRLEQQLFEQTLAYQELAFEKDEKAKRAEELLVINQELAFEKDEKAKRAKELLVINQELLDRLAQTVEIAMQLGEMRDSYTAGHQFSVGHLSAAIAAELGFDICFQEGIRVSGYLHDIGKIIVPIEILVKPAELTVEEFALVKTHVNAGYKVLKNINFHWPVSRTVLEHHERLDGSGYPNGLKGDEISIGGRIMAVADVVDAMSKHRPFRPGLGIDTTLEELERGSGIRYDNQVVDACIKLIRVKGYNLKESLIKHDSH
ncbi:MAG: PAS domain S-box protein [Methylophilales bacterium]|nr:PAS domain S-box protein [Methylophilales bacterium]